MTGQNTSTAVMNRRAEPADSLDYFPTPPWATRVLLEYVIPAADGDCLEPACGEGHMARPLAERFEFVAASDVHDYGFGEVRDFLATLWTPEPEPCDWIITNPPFKRAEDFALRALKQAQVGVALLVRTSFLEGVGRYQRIFDPYPPSVVAQFTERVVLHKGRLSEKGSTATAYCWIVWEIGADVPFTEFEWIPPCRKRLERRSDYR